MAKRRKPQQKDLHAINDFSGGLVTQRPPSSLAPNEAAVCENLDLQYGFLRRRSGYSRLHPADLPLGAPDTIVTLTKGYALLDGVDDYISTPDDGALDLSTVLDVRLALLPDDWAADDNTTNGTTLISKSGAYSVHLYYSLIANAFAWGVVRSSGGVVHSQDDALGFTPVNGTPLLVRFKLDTVTGTLTSYFKTFVEATYQADLDNDAGWSAGSTLVSGAWMQGALDNSANELRIGADAWFSGDDFKGKIWGMVLKGGGAAVANPDFGIRTHSTNPFADASGKTWTRSGHTRYLLPGESVSIPSESPPDTTVRSLFTRYTPDGTSLLAIADRNLIRSLGADFQQVGIFPVEGPIRATFAQVSIPGSSTHTVYMAVASGPDATPQALFKSNGASTLEPVSGSPTGRFVYGHQDALWVAGGGAANPNRLYWSSTAPDHETFLPSNYVDVDPTDGDQIMALSKVQGALVVLKRRSLHRIVGIQPSDAGAGLGEMQVYSYRDEPGCVAPRSVDANKGMVVYLGVGGIYGFDGTQTIELTRNVRPIFRELNQFKLEDAYGCFVEDDHYLLSVTTSRTTEPNLLISLRLNETPVVTLWRGKEIEDLGTGLNGLRQTTHNMSVYAIERMPRADRVVPVLGLDNSVQLMDDSYTDDGERVRWQYRTGVLLGMGDPRVRQLIRRGTLSARRGGGLIELSFLPNHATTPRVSFNLNSDQPTATGEESILIPFGAVGDARRWSVELAGEGNGPSPDITELLIEFITRYRT